MFLKMIFWVTVAGGVSTDLGGHLAFCDLPKEHNLKVLLVLYLVPHIGP